MNRFNFLFVLSLLFVFVAPSIKAERWENGGKNHPAFDNVTLSGTETFRSQDTTQDIRLASTSYANDKRNLLYLNFDQDSPHFLTDESGHYKIQSAIYIRSNDARSGKSSALFNRLDNKISIYSPEGLWPYTTDLNDFSIQFWIKPFNEFKKSGIIKKISLLEGTKIGLEIYLDEGHIKFAGWNLFVDEANQRHTVQLTSKQILKANIWNQVTFSFKASSGKLLLSINDKEDKMMLTKDKTGVWRGRFHPLDRSPFIIGESFVGLIDEFRIISAYVHPEINDAEKNSIYPLLTDVHDSYPGNQKKGQVISDVIEVMEEQKATRGRLRYDYFEPEGTVLNFYVRTSPSPFRKTDQSIPWKRVDRKTDHLPPFLYFQWRADLKADPTGANTPVLKSVMLEYTPTEIPLPPADVRTIAELSKDERAVLEWSLNPEKNIRDKGGYYIYYGVRPGRYLGRLKVKNREGDQIRQSSLGATPMTAEEKFLEKHYAEPLQQSLSKKVRVVVQNRMIEANILRSERNREFPYLKNDHTYYFAVSAVDESGEESPLSKETWVTIRKSPDL